MAWDPVKYIHYPVQLQCHEILSCKYTILYSYNAIRFCHVSTQLLLQCLEILSRTYMILYKYNASIEVQNKARNPSRLWLELIPLWEGERGREREREGERANGGLAPGSAGSRGVCGFPLCTARSQSDARLSSIAFRLERNAKDSPEIEFRPLLLPLSLDTMWSSSVAFFFFCRDTIQVFWAIYELGHFVIFDTAACNKGENLSVRFRLGRACMAMKTFQNSVEKLVGKIGRGGGEGGEI